MNILIGLALTIHMDTTGDYNSYHPHVRFEEGQFIAGAYYNSERNVSPYIGAKLSNELGYFEYGIVSGYEGQAGALPYARLGLTLSETGSLFIAPAFEKIYGEITTGTVIGFEILY
jgi:hypothetical protein